MTLESVADFGETNWHFGETNWGTADGRKIKVKDMTLGHLVNVTNWVHDHHGRYPDHIREGFIQQVKARQFELFAAMKPYPTREGDRWVIMDPKNGTTSVQMPPKKYIEAVKDNPRYQAMREDVEKIRAKRRQKTSG